MGCLRASGARETAGACRTEGARSEPRGWARAGGTHHFDVITNVPERTVRLPAWSATSSRYLCEPAAGGTRGRQRSTCSSASHSVGTFLPSISNVLASPAMPLISSRARAVRAQVEYGPLAALDGDPSGVTSGGASSRTSANWPNRDVVALNVRAVLSQWASFQSHSSPSPSRRAIPVRAGASPAGIAIVIEMGFLSGIVAGSTITDARRPVAPEGRPSTCAVRTMLTPVSYADGASIVNVAQSSMRAVIADAVGQSW